MPVNAGAVTQDNPIFSAALTTAGQGEILTPPPWAVAVRVGSEVDLVVGSTGVEGAAIPATSRELLAASTKAVYLLRTAGGGGGLQVSLRVEPTVNAQLVSFYFLRPST